MSIKGIISISGFPGLYKVLTQTKTGFIVESLADKKRTAVSSTDKISMLEDISIFTITDDIPLKEVLLKIKSAEKDTPVIPAKSDPKKLREYFRTVLPDFDEERVYTSDIKKIINWYSFVKDILEEDEPESKEDNSDSSEISDNTSEATDDETKVD